MSSKPESLEARRARVHITHLRDELEKIEARQQVLAEQHKATLARLNAALDAHGEPGPAPEPVEITSRAREVEAELAPGLSVAEATAGARRLGAFTPVELAAVLAVKPREVTKILRELSERGIVELTGDRSEGKPRYRYLAPETPGRAFELQREAKRSAASTEDELRPVVEGVGSNNTLLGRVPKQMRPTVREAISQGWDMRQGGSGHLVLSRDGHAPVTVPLTPSVPDTAALQVKRNVRRSRSRFMRRVSGPAAPAKIEPEAPPERPKRQKRAS